MNINARIQQNQPLEEIIDELTAGRSLSRDTQREGDNSLHPEAHAVNDPRKRPYRIVKRSVEQIDDITHPYAQSDQDKAQGLVTVYEDVNRVSLSMQKLIISRAVAFLFGNPVSYHATPQGEDQEKIYTAFEQIVKQNRLQGLDRQVARDLFAYSEVAEYWYPVALKPEERSTYGIDTSFRLRVTLFSPRKGDRLFPYFDSEGDLTAFSRYYKRNEKESSIEYFETYTDSEIYLFQCVDEEEWTLSEGYPRRHPLGKIPIVYGTQPRRETAEVDKLIERLETLLSNFADTNDYHASPKIVVPGQVQGFAQKGDAGAIIEVEQGCEPYYLSWQSAPEAVRLEIETLLEMIYTLTQTPNIAFSSVKGLGAVSGIALKLMFMDAHLKVQDKREIFDPYLARRVNLIKRYVGLFDSRLYGASYELEIEPEITPYMLTSESDNLKYWIDATGGKALISQREAVQHAGLSNDPERTMEYIQHENDMLNAFDITEPTI